jgi:biotin-(acetyl-CoA carboxylase) ligase
LSSPLTSNYKTTHISKYVKNISREKYFEIFVNYFLYYFNDFLLNKDKDFIIEYKKIQMFLNTNIKIKIDENKIVDGKFIGINDDGSLMLIKDNQKLSIYSGQIQV